MCEKQRNSELSTDTHLHVLDIAEEDTEKQIVKHATASTVPVRLNSCQRVAGDSSVSKHLLF